MELKLDNLNITRQLEEQEKQNKSLEQLYRNTQQNTAETDTSAQSTGIQKQESLISMPKGGGAVAGIGEKFQANPVTGTANITVPIMISPGRNGFAPQLALSYDSGSGNSPFGLGWNIGLPSISRKTSKGLPKYIDNPESTECDVFLLSGAEDLVPFYDEDLLRKKEENGFEIIEYRPRIEGLFAKIERHRNKSTNEIFWKTTTKENLTTYYGQTESSRISHPDDSTKVFQWLIDKTEDSLGNIMIYNYISENSFGIDKFLHEKNRLKSGKSFNQKYLKSIFYGNKEPFSTDDWLFQLVFDYKDNFADNNWQFRPDAFSTFNSGFEIRTYRLCHKILMYHNFAELGENPVLVKSTNLDYDENPVATQLTSVVHTFYSEYINEEPKSLPAVEFIYSKAVIDERIHTLELNDLKYIPAGLDGSINLWQDVNDEGISGILTETLNGWYYMENHGDRNFYRDNPAEITNLPEPHFGNPVLLHEKPSLASISNGFGQLSDIDGDGNTELMIVSDSLSGYFEKDDKKIYEINHENPDEKLIKKLDKKWSIFKPFKQMPNINMQDPNLKFIDLSGDGHADIIISEDNCFVCYESTAKDGYKAAYRTVKSFDEEKGPAVIFSDAQQSIYLANMTGSGMSDILRIRNGEICYWANLGYGKFSEKIAMDNSPHFDYTDKFNQSRIRLADIDGSGTTDIIYLGDSTVKYYKNLSGNGFSDAVEIKNFPRTDNIASVSAFDLMGKGTACLVWSSPLPADKPFNVKFIDLMSGTKPYLLTEMTNNMGAKSVYNYAPSTKFYLRAKRNMKPWITKLPFPVHVLEKVEVEDFVQATKFSTRYAYNHGYFDPNEREFRGFAMVEQWDTENFTNQTESPDLSVLETLDQPPIYTKTWFHNGAFINQKEISQLLEKEYFRFSNNQTVSPDLSVLKNSVQTTNNYQLTPNDYREAARALKGRVLRTEVYALDNNPDKENIPYTITQQTYTVKQLQPKLENKFGVFLTTQSETVSIQMERSLEENRISHQMILETDKFGNPLKSAQIAYPRNLDTETDAQQKELVVTVTETDYINEDNNPDFYRHSVPYQTKLWQLFEIETSDGLLKLEALISSFNIATEIFLLDNLIDNQISKKLIDFSRTYFYDEDVADINAEGEITYIPLLLGQISHHGLQYQTQQAVFGQEHKTFNQNNFTQSADFINEKAGYIEADEYVWKKSGTQLFDITQFFLPYKNIDQFDNQTTIFYDENNLFPVDVTDALGYSISAEYDYRFLQPKQMTDQNGNQTFVEFDTLGVVSKMILDGKGQGDTTDFPTEIYAYNVRNFYDNQKPNYSHTIKYTEHNAQNPQSGNTDNRSKIESYTYFTGTGQTIMQKVQAENGKWIGSGRIILNNKAKPVKQYEPYFSNTYEFENEPEVVENGVSPILIYDPVGRLIKTILPDGTFTKVEFTPWQQKIYDPNDTVLQSEWLKKVYPDDVPVVEPQGETNRAVFLSAQHANTPQVIDFDTLGRPYKTTDDNGLDDEENPLKYSVTNVYDVRGNKLQVFDAKKSEQNPKGRLISNNLFDMSGRLLRSVNIGSGERKFFYDTADKPIVKLDSREHCLHFTYDELQRPLNIEIASFQEVEGQLGDFQLIQQTIYGQNPDYNNIGQIYYLYDQSGQTIFNQYDFKGNLLQTRKKLTTTYNQQIDWNASQELTAETYIQTIAYDALNRITQKTQPDGSITKYTYNTGALLEKVDFTDSAGIERQIVTNIDYNSRRQRAAIQYGNGTGTSYIYDDKTFRLKQLTTTRNSDKLQDLSYFYDAVGNIVQLTDNAQRTIYFDNQEVEAKNFYKYDPVYRLVEAKGRELKGLLAPGNSDYSYFNNIPDSSETNALQNYTQKYKYDELGNIEQMSSDNWTRDYHYNGVNQLLKLNDATLDQYQYDAHGNMLCMPHLPEMKYDYLDQLNEVALGSNGNKAYYNYDYTGTRSRKTIVKSSITEETIYFGDYEIYRKFVSGTLNTMIETNHISEGKQKICIVDKTISGTQTTVNYRFQITNHLGSSCIELDLEGNLISYEEYHPFGTTSYRAGRNAAETSLKRYKYVMKELDNETGLYYYGMRYYSSSLARFVSLDPLQVKYPQYTPYQYAGNKPVTFIDLDGLEEDTENYIQEGIWDSPSGSKIITDNPNNEGFKYGGHQVWEINNEWNDDYIKAFGEYSSEMQEEYYNLGYQFTCEDLQLKLVIDFAKENQLPFHFKTLGRYNGASGGLNFDFLSVEFNAAYSSYDNFEDFRDAVLNYAGAADLTSEYNSIKIEWDAAQSGDFVGLLRGSDYASHIQPIAFVINDDENFQIGGYDGNIERRGKTEPSSNPKSKEYIGGDLRKWKFEPNEGRYYRNDEEQDNYLQQEPSLWRFDFLQWNKYK